MTFRYGHHGPQGLVRSLPVYIVVASGGTKLESEVDFISAWLKHVLGFMGLRDLHWFQVSAEADREVSERSLKAAMERIG